MELINKDAVLAEIEKLSAYLDSLHEQRIIEKIHSIIDTLEVKEVDLDFEKELYKAFGQVKDFTLGMCIARHFYELGLKTKKGE